MTAGELVWESFKSVGGFAGFASTAYVLWDRFWHDTPSAVVLARPIMEGSKTLVPVLAVRNISNRPIIMRWRHGPGPGFRLAKNDTSRGVIETLFAGDATATIDPEATRIFHLLKPNDYDEIDPDNVIELEITWKFAQPIILQTERRIRIAIRKSNLEALVEE